MGSNYWFKYLFQLLVSIIYFNYSFKLFIPKKNTFKVTAITLRRQVKLERLKNDCVENKVVLIDRESYKDFMYILQFQLTLRSRFTNNDC